MGVSVPKRGSSCESQPRIGAEIWPLDSVPLIVARPCQLLLGFDSVHVEATQMPTRSEAAAPHLPWAAACEGTRRAGLEMTKPQR